MPIVHATYVKVTNLDSFSQKSKFLSNLALKGRVWYKYKYILKDGRTYPETAAIFFFYEKFVVLVRQQLRPALIFSVIPSHLSLQTHHTQQGVAGAVHSVGGGFRK